MHGVIRTAYQDTSYFKSFSGSEKGTGVGLCSHSCFSRGSPGITGPETFWYQRPVELRDPWAAAEGTHLGGRVRPSSRDVILCGVPWSEHSSLMLERTMAYVGKALFCFEAHFILGCLSACKTTRLTTSLSKFGAEPILRKDFLWSYHHLSEYSSLVPGCAPRNHTEPI